MGTRHNYPTSFGFDPDADPGVLEDPDLARFGERYCKLIKGKDAGTPVKLLPWQRALFRDIQKARRQTDSPLVALVGMGRKNGKSLLGAIVALHGLVGAGEEGAEVYSCAGDRRQAGIVFEAAKEIVGRSPELSRVVKPYRNELVVPKTGSIYRALSAEAYSKEGYNPSTVVFDEVHVQPNAELWDVMRNGMGTRDRPLMFAITTAGGLYNARGEPSFCHQMYRYGKQVASGEVNDPAFFFRWWEAPAGADWKDPATWRAANPSLGRYLKVADLEALVRGMMSEEEFRTKRCNQWVTSLQSWFPFGLWSSRAAPRLVDGPVVIGFDGSVSLDSTALIGATVGDSPYVFEVETWERPAGDPGWRVPRAEVLDRIRQACAEYEVVELIADPSYWRLELQQLEAEGLPVVEFPNQPARTAPATRAFELAVQDGRLTHDGSFVLARHVENARIKVSTAGRYISKDHKNSPLKIDAAVAAIMAVDRATQVKRSRARLAVL